MGEPPIGGISVLTGGRGKGKLNVGNGRPQSTGIHKFGPSEGKVVGLLDNPRSESTENPRTPEKVALGGS